jgi:D-amino-acid oxidase
MKIAIIGGGITGFTTGVKLLEAGHAVTILSRDLPEKTTSYVAAAVGYPSATEESPRSLGWFIENNKKQTEAMRDPNSGLSWIDWYKCWPKEECAKPFWLDSVAGAKMVYGDECPYKGNKSGIYAPLVFMNVDKYFPYMRGRFKSLGGIYKTETISDFDDVSEDFELIINCTGVHAVALTNDADIHPARGQIVWVKNPGVKIFYSMFESTNYIYPRGELCGLGGSFEEGNWDATPDEAVTKRILSWAAEMDERLAGAQIVEIRVGLRPIRSTVRLEKEILPNGRTVIHNYGHGGAGYTLAWGSAADVLKLVSN